MLPIQKLSIFGVNKISQEKVSCQKKCIQLRHIYYSKANKNVPYLESNSKYLQLNKLSHLINLQRIRGKRNRYSKDLSKEWK